jgi:U6 snRNA-associated Sm-like protein LSm6
MSGQAALTAFLQAAAGHRCLVVLTTGSELQGILCTIDGLFNLVLREAVEFVGGQQTNTFPSVFVRGNKVVHLAPIEGA